jgi:hypothetical protein
MKTDGLGADRSSGACGGIREKLLGLVSAFDGMIPLPGDYCVSGRFQSAVSSRLFERAPARI